MFKISNILAIRLTLIYTGNPNILGNPQGHPQQKKNNLPRPICQILPKVNRNPKVGGNGYLES